MATKKKAGADVQVEVLPVLEGDNTIPTLDLVPYVDETVGIAFKGNYDALKAYLTDRCNAVMTIKFTASNMETVMKYKKEAQSYRTYLDAIEKNIKRKYFNDPKTILSALIADLQTIVAKIEDKAGTVLAREEEKRAKALTQVLEIYKADFQAQYNLSDAGLASIEYKQSYYNKTAKEAETKADIELQFNTIRDREKARESGERMVRKLCAGNPLLNVDSYIKMLDTKELALIMDEIEAEEKRLAEVAAAAKVKEEPVVEYDTPITDSEVVEERPALDVGSIKLGVMGKASKYLTGGTDFPGMEKKRTRFELEYPVDLGDALNAIFDELVQYGIVARPLKSSGPDVF